ncbi:ABC transporter permease [Gephyromycinifex aptenodytis]|uniref:ABC transporter permease n=1 Tax=Gephyromycinifex aptenodytis TaxID=2716227 RepID=UPI001447C4EF|nr:ABC transporter permease [Gephyromycinifex aptenodytis]
MISGLLGWFADPATWAGPSGIPARLGEHILYTVVVLVIAAAFAIPAGLFIGHTGRGKWIVTSTNAARAVPSLGLLFAVALWLGPRLPGEVAFLLPSLIALVVLAIPPLLSGAYSGVEAVDPAARDAARGMGMRGSQVLLKVELPCSLPLLFSGLRSATLQVVATATIASFISLGGLGVFLVQGLAGGDYPQMAGGAFLVALLALVADGALALAQRFIVPAGLRIDDRPRGRRRGRLTPSGSNTASAAGPEVTRPQATAPPAN